MSIRRQRDTGRFPPDSEKLRKMLRRPTWLNGTRDETHVIVMNGLPRRFGARNYYGCAHHDQRKTPCVGVGVLDDPSGKFDLDGQIFPLSAAAGSGGCRGRHPLHEIIFHNNDTVFGNRLHWSAPGNRPVESPGALPFWRNHCIVYTAILDRPVYRTAPAG